VPRRGEHPFPAVRTPDGNDRRRCAGQAILETVIAVFVLIVCFLYLFEFSTAFTARILASHGAARAARARTVGFNRFMAEKTALAAMIPASGECLSTFDGDPHLDGSAEAARVPDFLAQDDWGRAYGVLDYKLWPATRLELSASGLAEQGEITAQVIQARPRFSDFTHAESGGLRVENEGTHSPLTISGTYKIENHCAYYMNDEGR